MGFAGEYMEKNIARWSEKGGSVYIELIVGESGDRMIRSRVLQCELER